MLIYLFIILRKMKHVKLNNVMFQAQNRILEEVSGC